MTSFGDVRDPSVEITAFVAGVRRRLRRAQLWRAVGRGGGIGLGGMVVLLAGAALVPGAAWRPLALLLGGGGLGVAAVLGWRAAGLWRRGDAPARLGGQRRAGHRHQPMVPG